MQTLEKFFAFMAGKKTYCVALLTAVYTLLKAFWITTTPEQDMAVYGLLAALFGASIRSAIK